MLSVQLFGTRSVQCDRMTRFDAHQVVQNASLVVIQSSSNPFPALSVQCSRKIFFQYAKFYPTKVGKNEAMIGRIVDLYKKQKKKDELLNFVKSLKSTGVRLSSKFVNRLNKIVLTTQFASVQKANKKGDKKYALKGYLMIYKE